MDRWSQLSMSEKSDLMSLYIKNGISSLEEIKKHYNSFATGGNMSPDHDPNHPYHYHDANGNKIVITPEDWEANVGKPYFKEIEDAVRAEQAAYPEPEYEVNPDFVRDLRSTYRSNMGNGYQNYRNFSSYLPQGYTFSSEGMIVDPQGNYYVQSGYRQSPRFTYSTDNPLNVNLSSINKNLTFYPVNMDKRVKAPLPVDRVMNVNNEREKAIENYIETNTTPKQRINYINSVWVSYLHPELATSDEKKDHYRGIRDARKLGYNYIIDNFEPGQFNGWLIGFTDKDWNKFKQDLWNKASYEYNGKKYISVDGYDYDETLFFNPNWYINTANSISDPVNWSDGPKGNQGFQTRYIGGKPSNQEAEKKAVISIGPLEKVNTFADGGHLYEDGGPTKTNHVTFGTYDENGNVIPAYRLNQVNIVSTQPYRTPEQEAQVTAERNMYFDAMRHFNNGNQDAEGLKETYTKYPELRSYLKRIGMSENDFMAAATGRDYETNSYEKERTRQFNKDIQRAEANKANKLMQSVSHQNPNDKKLAAAMTGILGGVTGTGILGGLTSVGGLGNTVSNATNIALQGSKTALGAAGKMMLPSTWTTAAGISSGLGAAADATMFTDMVYHGGKNLLNYNNWQSNGIYNNDNWGGWQGGANLLLDLASVAPITKAVKGGVELVNNAGNFIKNFESPILSQRTPNTLTRVIGSGTTGLEDAVITAGYLRGNPNGGITTAKNLNRRYLPKLKQAGASQGLYDRFASNALTEKDYEWLHKNMPEDWFIDSTPAEEGVVSLKKGVLPQTYKEYLQMYRSNNPQRTNVDIRTGEGLTSEDIAYNWAGENEPTFAVSKDIAKEMGYDYENILNNSLFRGDYAVQIKNARTHGVSGNNFPTGAHLDEHWSLKYPMEWNNPDVSFYKGFNIPLLNKKVYFKTNPIKSLLKKIESDYAAEIAKPKSEQNLERLQELRNQHFLAASPDNAVSKYTRQWWGKPLVTMFHGSPEHNGAFTEFNPKKSGGQFFFSPSEMYADTYGYGTKPRSFYLNADEFVGGYKETNTPGIWEPILENNEQVVRRTVKNNTKAGSIEGDMEFIVGDNRMIKSADPITYDNNGNVISLSKRDNFNISDIRYILPFGIGTGATLLNSNKN